MSKTFMLTIVGILFLLLVGQGNAQQPMPTPTRMLRPSPTVVDAIPFTSTPYPAPIDPYPIGPSAVGLVAFDADNEKGDSMEYIGYGLIILAGIGAMIGRYRQAREKAQRCGRVPKFARKNTIINTNQKESDG